MQHRSEKRFTRPTILIHVNKSLGTGLDAADTSVRATPAEELEWALIRVSRVLAAVNAASRQLYPQWRPSTRPKKMLDMSPLGDAHCHLEVTIWQGRDCVERLLARNQRRSRGAALVIGIAKRPAGRSWRRWAGCWRARGAGAWESMRFRARRRSIRFSLPLFWRHRSALSGFRAGRKYISEHRRGGRRPAS